MSSLFPAKGEQSAEIEVEAPDLPAAGPKSDAGGLCGLVEQFVKLGQSLDQTNGLMAAYLLRRESHVVTLTEQEGVVALAERVEALGKKLEQLRNAIAEQKEAVAGSLHELRRRVDSGLAELTEHLQPVKEAVTDVPTASDGWLRAILGPMLAKDPALRSRREQFAQDILSDNTGACSLAGQLLVFQSASPERMPALLKDIGEAYYRWQPKRAAGNGPMEEALAVWLQRACDNAGISNTIELVHPSERFDSTRHTASGRGVEIAEVFGWIVLRDNGKVYTKASVAVK